MIADATLVGGISQAGQRGREQETAKQFCGFAFLLHDE